ncbi:hypothetical protein ACIOD2_14840 [Amycolatopsis sp. NPDC088138]|uniref:hypothetical protein n=1 Tax=Amycolatopsis sp. NPDC088138 TaxID=3363938 RepID=UPI00381C5FD6
MIIRERVHAPDHRTRPGRTVAVFAVAVLVAAYTGFRLPGPWVATLDTVSVTDGFHRRFLVGTLLRPVALATGFDVRVFAAASFAVLAMLLAVVAIAFVRAGNASRRLVILAWLLLPTGGFLFHEVGYYEQLLYLLLFGALWLLPRRPAAASGLLTAGVLVHEITLLTVLPIFVLALSARFPLRRVVRLAAPPVFLELVVLGVPASAPGSADRLLTALRGAGFPVRADALALFERTQEQSWALYSIGAVLLTVVPIAVVVLAGFRALRGPAGLLQSTAIGAPALLAFAGWDSARWGFLLVTNFAVVLWLWLGERELDGRRLVVLGATLLVLAHVPLPYFDGHAPRELSGPGVVSLFSA